MDRISSALAAILVAVATPAGAGPLLLSPLSFDFGYIYAGATSPTQVVTITNTSNTPQSPNFAGGAPINGQFSGSQNCGGKTLQPGESCQFSYYFKPTTLGDVATTTSIQIDGESTSFEFKGVGINPFLTTATSFDFGNIAVGSTSATQAVTITNVSGATQSPNFAGGAPINGQFSGSQNCGGKTFAPGESCQFSYYFQPTALGDVTTTTSIQIDGVSYDLGFTGTGLDPFLVSALAYDFGGVALGETSPIQTVNITNVSGATQSPNFAGGAPINGQFSGSQNCGGKTFAPGESCQFSYYFKPTTLGDVTTTTSIQIDGRIRSFTFYGEGLAEAPPPHRVPLPSSLALVMFGPLLLGVMRRRSYLARSRNGPVTSATA